ncbi:MAG: M50 family metallopeptidase [Myxococcota bacterium]
MTESWSFRAFGFRINVQMSFLVLAGLYVLMGLQAQLPLIALVSWPIVIFLSIVWHELGHAATARYLKVPVGDIELHGLGGHVTTGRSDARRQLLISLAGPGAGILLGLVAIFATQALGYDPFKLMWTGPWYLSPELIVLSQILFVNIVWSLVNLLPMRPLDGGNALLAMLTLNLRDSQRARQITAMVGLTIGAFAIAWAWTSGRTFLLLLAGYFTLQNYLIWQSGR